MFQQFKQLGEPDSLKELSVSKYGTLNIVCGSAGSGKNSYMIGISRLINDRGLCAVILTESEDKQLHDFGCSLYFKTMRNIEIKELVGLIGKLVANGARTIFIEQYQPKNDDLIILKNLCDSLNIEIFIGIQSHKKV